MKRTENIKFSFLILLLFMFDSLIPFQLTAQHHHNNKNNDSYTEIFSNESSYGKVTIFSSNYPLNAKKNIDFHLTILMKDTSMKLNIGESKIMAMNLNNKNIYYLNFRTNIENKDMFSTSLNLAETGNYKFELNLIIQDSLGEKHVSNFEFTQNVKDEDVQNSGSHHGSTGMGTEMWLIMGAAMIAMMAVVIMAGTNHR